MFANIGPVQLLIVLLIVLAIFGTKRLRTLGSDLGSAVKGFRSAVEESPQPKLANLQGKPKPQPKHENLHVKPKPKPELHTRGKLTLSAPLDFH